MRRGVGSGFANADADPGQQQVPEVDCQAANRRHPAEYGERPSDDATPAPAIRPLRQRDAEARVEEGKGEPRQEAECRIGKMEVLLDRLDQDGENLPIHEVEGEYRQEEPQGIPPVPPRSSIPT